MKRKLTYDVHGNRGHNLTHLMDEGLTADQSVQARQTQTVFYGWWNHGLSDLTLSPFHLAKLFDAPLLKDVNSKTGTLRLIRDVVSLPIKLGLVETPTHTDSGLNEPTAIRAQTRESRLGIAEPQTVAAPWKGMRLSE